jgi:hypothetical protein
MRAANGAKKSGIWADPQAALERWLDEKDDLLAGRIPRSRKSAADEPNLRDLCKKFLVTKLARRDVGELSPHTYQACHGVCDELGVTFGGDRLLIDILPEDFEKLFVRWAAKWGVERLAAEINRARTVFNYAYVSRLIKQPMVYGEGFARPSKKVLRLNKAAKGAKMFEADGLRRMIAAAKQPMKAMLLLAINAGSPRQIAQFVSNLESDTFQVREKATQDLTKLGEFAGPALRAALKGKPSLEAERRIMGLLEGQLRWSPERLQAWRALAVLERANTSEAKTILEKLASGAPEARQTIEARAALLRLRKQTKMTP